MNVRLAAYHLLEKLFCLMRHMLQGMNRLHKQQEFVAALERTKKSRASGT
jgi:hypothetical protein